MKEALSLGEAMSLSLSETLELVSSTLPASELKTSLESESSLVSDTEESEE